MIETANRRETLQKLGPFLFLIPVVSGIIGKVSLSPVFAVIITKAIGHTGVGAEKRILFIFAVHGTVIAGKIKGGLCGAELKNSG